MIRRQNNDKDDLKREIVKLKLDIVKVEKENFIKSLKKVDYSSITPDTLSQIELKRKNLIDDLNNISKELEEVTNKEPSKLLNG